MRIPVRVQNPTSAAEQDAADDHHRDEQTTARAFLLHGRVESRHLVHPVFPAGRMQIRFVLVGVTLGGLDFGFVPIGAVGVVTLGTDLNRFPVVVALLAERRTDGDLHDLRLVATWGERG